MPTDQLLSAAATTLRPFARRVWRLSSERRAAVPKLRTPHDIIEDLLDQTLHRLRKGDIDDVWWKRILTHFAHNYITPDFLQKPALRGWLADHRVAVAFKALATHLIATGTAHDGEYPNVLVESYSSHTGEASHLATVPIEVVLAVLVAGYIASVPADQRASFGVIQAGNTFNQEGFARLENLILEGGYLNAHDAKKLQSELDAILLLRTIDAAAARDKIHALLNHANDIRLASTNSDLNDRITYWAARLLALDLGTLPIAKQLRTQILAIHQSNTNIIDALIALTEGDTNQALRLVRDEPDSDSTSLFFSILADVQGERAALEWADQHESSSDPRFFNAQGWTNWAICCAKTDRWDQACQHLATLEHLSPNHPLLAFTEGRINAAMLLPQEYRKIVLHEVPLYPNLTTHQGSVAEEHHRRAVDCLQAASEAIERIAHEPFTRLIRQWTLWLSLVDPRKDKAQSTRNEIQHRMRIGTEAAQLIPFALVFDIPFDDAPLKQHIASHRTFGGLGDQEFRAEFLLLRNSESPRNLLNYIDKHRTHLKKIFAPDLLTGAEVESLAADGQTQRARTLLQENSQTFVDEDYSRLTLLIETHEGHDPRPHLEDIYSKTKSLADLKNLIAHLVAVNDTTELRTLTMDLFSRERTIQNSLQVVSALIGPTQFDYPSVIEFLDTIPDLVTQSDDLKSSRAWAFLAAGRIHEAKIISDDLLIRRQHPNDFRLDTKIIVASGDWERLGNAIHREWPRRHTHDAATVMHMAALARQSGQDPDRALELARIATQKAPDDPEILAAAYWLHCKLGAEAQADPNWLNRASVLSSEDEGPIWRIELTEALNHFFPKRRDLMDQIERKWLGGELPIGGAATVLNASLARLLLHLPEQNARRLDGRERTILPTIDGGRSPCDLEPGWTIGLDVTSVMVLHFLGILDQTIGSFRHIKLSSDIMELLFHERDDALFHQPSRAASAKQICDLRNSDRIRLAKTGRRPPAELVEEVGLEMASLLHSADTNCGTVIAVLPLHRPESLLQERARTDTHEHLIISIVDFCAYLYQEGKLDADDHRRAISFLSSRGQPRTSGSPCSDTGPFYIDDVALTYLQEANVIEPLTAAGLDIQIHPNVHARAVALVEEGAAGYDIVATVDSIRTILRRAIDECTASFLPAMVSHDEPTQQDAPSLATTVSLLGAASACDALCIDDRYFNPAYSRRSGEKVGASADLQ